MQDMDDCTTHIEPVIEDKRILLDKTLEAQGLIMELLGQGEQMERRQT